MRPEPTPDEGVGYGRSFGATYDLHRLVLVEAPHFFDTWIGAGGRLVAG